MNTDTVIVTLITSTEKATLEEMSPILPNPTEFKKTFVENYPNLTHSLTNLYINCLRVCGLSFLFIYQNKANDYGNYGNYGTNPKDRKQNLELDFNNMILDSLLELDFNNMILKSLFS